MLDLEKIRRLVEMMVANDLVEISLRDGEEEVNLRRPNTAAGNALVDHTLHGGLSNPGSAAIPIAPAASPAALPASDEKDANLVEIESPMVGTFYAASDPDSSPFVTVGQQVHVGMVVCILEAMKVFNEIKAEVAGTIERILVKNAEAVEYGQPLFLVRVQ